MFKHDDKRQNKKINHVALYTVAYNNQIQKDEICLKCSTAESLKYYILKYYLMFEKKNETDFNFLKFKTWRTWKMR